LRQPPALGGIFAKVMRSMSGRFLRRSLWRCLATLAVAVLCLSSVTPSMAQTAPAGAGVQATASSDPAAKRELPASLVHSAVKTATLKVASALVSTALFFGGTGSVADAGMLTAIMTVTSSALFASNDYLWDRFSPNSNIRANDEGFDALGSAWRNTLKYLTVKPALIGMGYGVIYWYTGSWASALTLGTASIFAFPLAFYGNNMAWDWYDWYSASGETSSDAGDRALQNGGT
jgi:uncharacterized membrane protein